MEFSLFANLLVAFLAGFLTFFAGCLAPIAPVYISFLAGSGPIPKKRVFLQNALFFTLGFITIFFIFGITVNSLAKILTPYQPILRKMAGLLLIFLGIQYVHPFNLSFVAVPFNFSVSKRSGTRLGALLLGASFGFIWTPCIGPVLATILLWISTQEHLLYGLFLLSAFSIGLALPFILIGVGFETFYPLFKHFNTYAPAIHRITGSLLILFGILILTNWYVYVVWFMLKYLGSGAFILTLQ